MSDDKTVEMNKLSLEKLIKALKGNIPKARVGVLADHNARKDGEETNASIGVKHELGLDGLPIRSFLRMPLNLKMAKNLEKSGAFDELALKKVIKDGNFDNYVEKIGVVGVATVLEAFQTGGFGQWKPSNMDFKETKQTLVETEQLERSITSDVQK